MSIHYCNYTQEDEKRLRSLEDDHRRLRDEHARLRESFITQQETLDMLTRDFEGIKTLAHLSIPTDTK